MPSIQTSTFCLCCCGCKGDLLVTIDATYAPCNNPNASGQVCLAQVNCGNWFLNAGSGRTYEVYYVTATDIGDGVSYTGYVLENVCGGGTYKWKLSGGGGAPPGGGCPTTTTSNGPLVETGLTAPPGTGPAASGINNPC